MRYRSKVIEIEALQWDGSDETATKITKWSDGLVEPDEAGGHKLVIMNEDGLIDVHPGDWVLTDNLTYWRVAQGLFVERYEPIPREIQHDARGL